MSQHRFGRMTSRRNDVEDVLLMSSTSSEGSFPSFILKRSGPYTATRLQSTTLSFAILIICMDHQDHVDSVYTALGPTLVWLILRGAEL